MIILKYLIPCLILSLGTGGLSGFIISKDIYYYMMLDRPLLSPPSAVFPVIWIILYILMGIAHYMIHISQANERENAIKTYYMQLLVNFLWPILFFRLKMLFISVIWIILLLVLVVKTAKRFYKIKPAAGILMIPYTAWLIFAVYLNVGVWVLN